MFFIKASVTSGWCAITGGVPADSDENLARYASASYVWNTDYEKNSP